MAVDIHGRDKLGEGWSVEEQGKDMFYGTNKMQEVPERIVLLCY